MRLITGQGGNIKPWITQLLTSADIKQTSANIKAAVKEEPVSLFLKGQRVTTQQQATTPATNMIDFKH
jgi:hypothetical protein